MKGTKNLYLGNSQNVSVGDLPRVNDFWSPNSAKLRNSVPDRSSLNSAKVLLSTNRLAFHPSATHRARYGE